MIIAEAGLNHMGSFDKALEYVRQSKECGADAVKFQYYIPETLCANRNNFDNYSLLKRIAMKPQWIPLLKKECNRVGIQFLCTCFCKHSAEEIAPYVTAFKVASPEVCDINFIRHLNTYGKPLIISTGKVDTEILDKIFYLTEVEITLLYCVSKYPAEVADYDLTKINYYMWRYNVPVGLSDHTKGIKTAIEASEKKASIIEKHFMIDKNCIDSEISLMPSDFKKMCDIIRRNYGR